MGHTYANVMIHGVFSTRGRRPMLNAPAMPELAKVIGGILRKRQGKLLALNGPDNHVHLLGIFHPKHALSDQFRDIKAISSRWVRERPGGPASFAWQTGYAAFSVSRSNAAQVESYIAGQAEHHRRQTFEEELVALLKRHGIDYDPRYTFD